MSDDEPREHRTLFAVRLLDARERRAVAAERRAPGARRGERSSDVTRVRAWVVAMALAAVGALSAWLLVPAAPARSSGPLALPHSNAKLDCQACHSQPGSVTGKACQRCHGAHGSQRSTHRELMQAGQLGCPRCHDPHGSDQGVRFSDSGTVRYGVGASRSEEHAAVQSDYVVTVPLIPVGRCQPCHQLDDQRDPIQRCILASQRSLGTRALNVCFDEHQRWSAVDPARAGGVCSEQHGNERFAAWEAARDVADASPWPPAAGRPGATWWWLGSGAGAGLLGLLGFSLVSRRRRRRVQAAQVAKPADRVRLPQIDPNTCLGCHACVDACPFDVLAVERYVAVVARPDACCGLTLCEQVCPNGSLVITDGEPIGGRPKLDAKLQSLDQPGVYLAGDITGLPLIKNAIMQGSRVMDSIAGDVPEHDLPLDVVIVGAGPAGISAALRAKELGLRYRVVEQGSVAQSIRSFPRGKLIFDQPLELPLAGKLWLEESTKEELLAKWLRLVREERLAIDEGLRFVGLESVAGGFELSLVAVDDDDDAPERLRAARVLLAIGMRGAPRKLPLALSEPVQSKVFYHLADARSFAGQRVMVVGLGDVAMEAAVALAHQPDTEVTLVHRGDGFRRGKPRNIAEVERLVQSGRIALLFDGELTAIEHDFVALRSRGKQRRIANDVVFVMIGAIAPEKLLAEAGVRIGARA